MAKAPPAKPKTSFADWFKKLAAPKPKAGARPASSASSTMTNLPAGGGPTSTQGASDPKKAASLAKRVSLEDFRLPLIGHLQVTSQMNILGTTALVLVVLTALMAFLDAQVRSQNATYVTVTSQMQFHTQRLAKAASLAARGQPSAFPQVQDSRDEFANFLDVLQKGGFAFGVEVPPAGSSDELKSRLQELNQRWPESSGAASAILAARNDLVQLAQNIAQIRVGSEEMAATSQELISLMTQSGSAPGQVLRANRLTVLAERLGRGSAEILGAETIDPEVPFLIGKDTNDLRDLIKALESGSEGLAILPVRDAEARGKLGDLKKQFDAFEKSVGPILRELQKLVSARQAGAQLVAGSEQLQSAVARLQEALQAEKSATVVITIFILVVLLVVLLLSMGFVFLSDTRRTAATAEMENRKNQQAILRLLNEMGDLADGDLTVKAEVTEDITGAIADSMNYTIDELRSLVTGVNSAAISVTQKTAHAQTISAELLGAAERQSKEIEETTSQVLQVSRSISEVSSTAGEGAQVAQRSLAAADKGRVAVENSILGMNDIRNQIQETSKRIKRLGESSQEIGEIVELIADITEQTNVLALNAAIQAASAGEAGRGFSVVAEEVQRLAERSGEATKQIGAIVKTIQADTQDAVAAMEKSTQGVVEGAKLSDAAGQALTEIDTVTKSLAQLIQQISQATNTQAEATNTVARNMQGILEITRQTTHGTQQTAGSIRDLSSVAQELKSSVSGFKL
ncbi:MAG: type IV pili methyl-accepting chemotaxis transducer N-terminal domain-containing protein [Betaproteobacteria bacterium]|nr:type IV pili methyl-accepting chemotaxis transducer N-terminal domain-containing protein [Betaproteobacteria bacterium]